MSHLSSWHRSVRVGEVGKHSAIQLTLTGNSNLSSQDQAHLIQNYLPSKHQLWLHWIAFPRGRSCIRQDTHLNHMPRISVFQHVRALLHHLIREHLSARPGKISEQGEIAHGNSIIRNLKVSLNHSHLSLQKVCRRRAFKIVWVRFALYQS